VLNEDISWTARFPLNRSRNQLRCEGFQRSSKAADIEVLEAPVECPTTFTDVERYHGPLHVAYNRLKLDDPTLSPEGTLALAVKCVNDAIQKA
jgi:hypothetical protein